jgi:hypothetical protein
VKRERLKGPNTQEIRITEGKKERKWTEKKTE